MAQRAALGLLGLLLASQLAALGSAQYVGSGEGRGGRGGGARGRVKQGPPASPRPRGAQRGLRGARGGAEPSPNAPARRYGLPQLLPQPAGAAAQRGGARRLPRSVRRLQGEPGGRRARHPRGRGERRHRGLQRGHVGRRGEPDGCDGGEGGWEGAALGRHGASRRPPRRRAAAQPALRPPLARRRRGGQRPDGAGADTDVHDRGLRRRGQGRRVGGRRRDRVDGGLGAGGDDD
jgi:hypothetical protein